MLKELSKLSRFIYVDKVCITLYHPNTVRPNAIFRNTCWKAEITFMKDDITLYKEINENNTELFIKKIIEAIETEQKI
jgi:hypothetical protein